MTRYAESTSVSVDKSRGEIERTLTRYGAEAFMYGWEGQRALISFRAKGRHIRFILPLPDKTDKTFTETPGRKVKRSPEQASAAWEQACRQSWRALALVIKAKLEAVAAGITEFESEFLANIVLPNGSTVGDHVRPEIAIAYQSHEMPTKLLPYHGGGHA